MATFQAIQTIVENNPTQAFEYGVYAILCGAPIVYGLLKVVAYRLF